MCSNTMTKVVGSSLGSRENRKPALAIHETPRPAEALRDGTEQAHGSSRMRVINFRQLRVCFSHLQNEDSLLLLLTPTPPAARPGAILSLPRRRRARAGSEVTAALVVTWFSAFTRKARRSQRAEPASRWRALAWLRVVASAPRSRSLSPERRRGWCGAARGPPRAAASEQGQAAGVRGLEPPVCGAVAAGGKHVQYQPPGEPEAVHQQPAALGGFYDQCQRHGHRLPHPGLLLQDQGD